MAWQVHQKVRARVELDDLIAYGQLGLVQAAQRYNEANNAQFTTFAYQRIRGAILDGLSTMGWFSRREYHKMAYRDHAEDWLDWSNDASSNDDTAWFSQAATGAAMVCILQESAESTEISGSTDADACPDAQAVSHEMSQLLQDAINTLEPKMAELIRMAYYQELSLEEAGARLGFSKSWASRLHAKALQKLAVALGDTSP